MPLDTTRQELEQLEQIRGVKATFLVTPEGLDTLIWGTQSYADLAVSALQVWHATSSMPDADLLMLRYGTTQVVVTPRPGLVIIGDRTLNAGILRQHLKKFPKEHMADSVELGRDTWSKSQVATWSFAERLGRIEAPRTFEVMIGEFEYVIEASRESLGIVEEDGGFDRLREKIALANEAGHAIEYTLGEPKTRNIRSRHRLAELFGQSDDDSWKIVSGWPASVPADATFFDIKTATAFGHALSAVCDTDLRADLLSEDGQKILSSNMQGSECVVTWAPGQN